MPKPKPKLPAALAKNALAKVAAAKKAALARAHDDLALIARKRLEIGEAFYDIGEALARLRKPPVPTLLGHANFAELCEVRLQMSAERAGSLIAIVTRVRREDALRWGQEKTAALVEISTATSASDSPADVAVETLKLPDGKRIDVEKASVRQLKEIAKSIRSRRGRGSVRGRTTTPQERKLAKRLEARLREEGIDGEVRAVATQPGAVSKLRIDVPADRLGALRTALRGDWQA